MKTSYKDFTPQEMAILRDPSLSLSDVAKKLNLSTSWTYHFWCKYAKK